jgi:hypothetical protein
VERLGRLDWIARLGFTARGVMYILFGTIALLWQHRADEGQSAVFETLIDMSGGWVLLAAGVVGLAAYGVFRVFSGWLDIERKGGGVKGWAGRIAQIGSGLIHLGLGYSALRFLLGWARSRVEDESSEDAARTALSLPLPDVWLYVIAAGFFFVGGLQLRRAWKASHMKLCRADTPGFACNIGRIGLITRGAIFAAVGWSFLQVARTHDADRAKAAGGALAELRSHDTLYLALCLGLILFGVFSLLLARYRIVPPIDVVERTKQEVRDGV